MCGIAGFYGHADPTLLRRMVRLLISRGPDDEGFYEDEQVGLGMRRLCIIDVAGGHQPIHNEDETIWVILNGEIYNYQLLRTTLEEKGHCFYTHSDTECLVHLYEEYGEDFVQHLRGMFAIALWDRTQKKLLLVRDRIGIKPLYYFLDNGRLFFASELKSLLSAPGFERELDPAAFQQYLSFLYIPAPHTIFRKIAKLPPGFLLSMENGRMESKPYWDLSFGRQECADEEEAAEKVLEVLDESVRMRMISDVPLGAFLSGGLDSSAIVGLMARHSSRPVKTFTVGFEAEGKGFNELEYARQIARHFDTEHHECTIDYDVIDLLPRVLWHFDEPFGNSTSVLAYLLSEFTRKHVTVALSGTGGDEAFMGYPRHLGLSMGHLYEKLPRPFRQHFLRRLIALLPESTASNFPAHRLAKRMRRFVEGMEMPEEDRYLSWLRYFDGEGQKRLTELEGDGEVDGFMYGYLGRFPERSVEDRAFYADIKTFLPYNQLEYMDKMSMAHSLEARVPFCDHELLEVSASLEHQWKLKGRGGKRVLKKACELFLPREIVHRRKVGFDAPTGEWFKGSLRPFCEALFSEKALKQTGIFRPEEVQRLMHLHLSGKRDLSLHLWMILIFEVWYRMYVVQEITDQPDFTLRELLGEQDIQIDSKAI